MPLEMDYSQIVYDDIEDEFYLCQNVFKSDDEFYNMKRKVDDVEDVEEEAVQEMLEEYEPTTDLL